MWKAPLFDVALDERERRAVEDVLRSGWLTMGERTAEFERRFAAFVGVRHAVAVSSGTAALHLAHLALGVGPGDEVICPALTFVAAANAIVYTGATPVFADISSEQDLNLSPKAVEERITPRTKAIQIVHYAGYPCQMDALLDVAHRHRLPLIEDSAHAPGAAYRGRRCGSLGEIGCFSFFSNKNMTTGEGGMVTTDDDTLAERVRLLRSHAMTTGTVDRYRGSALSYDVVALGYNYRLDEIRAALGLVQLEKLGSAQQQRANLTRRYRRQLAEVKGLHLPTFGPDGVPAHHLVPAVLAADVDRRRFMEGMKEHGVQTSIHYPPIHQFDFYRRRFGVRLGCVPVTEDVAAREVTLPLYPGMGEDRVDWVCRAVVDVLARLRSG